MNKLLDSFLEQSVILARASLANDVLLFQSTLDSMVSVLSELNAEFHKVQCLQLIRQQQLMAMVDAFGCGDEVGGLFAKAYDSSETVAELAGVGVADCEELTRILNKCKGSTTSKTLAAKSS